MRLVSHPVLCNYYVTYRCNAACGFCDIWEKPSPYITLDNFRQNLKDLKRLGVKVIDFTGGEPLLHRQLDLLLKEAKDQGMITTVTSNGLLYPKYAHKLKGLIDMLHFSLDSPIREEHDASRKVKCFDKVMESIALARSLGERPDIIFTVFDSNIDQIQQLSEEICQPNDLVLILNPVFEYNGVGDSLTADALKRLTWWGKQKNVYLNDAFVQLRLDGGNKVNDPVCKAGSTTLVISPENKLVLPCYHLGLKEFEIEGRLHDLYHSEEVQKLVALEGKLPACEGCAINCYMQPSFAVEINRYWWKALPSTLKYSRIKGTWKRLLH
ncbi:MoaA/NifB/PqqE/SkfB family radical SAM enzyme [Dyadobacter jejuensis]|uniref:MoaA/NifB/PqqE/SkfB family radical SAM enzyme n=1 Tax=Dyadobacter jejuensis TaxID=1082580 RepID=A0A316BCF1_9BACT|nr:radical SAM protein [Dyadobacter jejuensis]PWJ60147.1 MoaA/NifB/PqqE/SkfB family radical SAM enzyme [Dyadobacter jejuensis]